MVAYSHSKVQLYKQCPLKFRFQHIDKYPSEFETTADLVLWNAVHYSLEKLYTSVNNFHIPSLEEVLEKYFDFWEFKIDELKNKWEELIIKSVDNTLQDYKNRGENYLRNYYNNFFPFDKIKVVDTEANIYFKLDQDISFVGYIDRLDKDWDRSFVINDYKTNKRLPTEDKEQYFDQLTIYAKWICDKYWKYFDKIKARIYYLHFDIEDEWEITDESLQWVVQKYTKIIKEIEYKKKNYLEWNLKSFEPQETPLCNFCEFKSMCPLFSHSYMDDEFVSSLSEKSIKTLIDEYWNKNEEKKNLDKELKELKKIFVEYLKFKKENISKLYGNKYKLNLKQSIYYKYPDKQNFLEELEKKWDFLKVSDVSSSKIKKAIESWELDFENYKNFLIKTISNILNVSKID